MPAITCKLTARHISSLGRLSKGAAGATLSHLAFSKTKRRIAGVPKALPLSNHVWLPAHLPGVAVKVPDITSWFLAHPFWTLVAGTVLVAVVPRVTKV